MGEVFEESQLGGLRSRSSRSGVSGLWDLRIGDRRMGDCGDMDIWRSGGRRDKEGAGHWRARARREARVGG